jgi:hypothetical protein
VFSKDVVFINIHYSVHKMVGFIGGNQ